MLDTDLIKLSAEMTHAEVHLIPNIHAPLTASHIQELITHSPYRNFCPDEKSISAAVAFVNKLCGQETGADTCTFTVAEKHDAKLDITMSADKMQAKMCLTADWGGKEVTLDEVLAELKTQNIQFGVDSKVIISQLKTLKITPPGEQLESVIANGKPAIDGEDAYLERKVSLAKERLLKPQKRTDDTVDMRDLGKIVMVKPNDLLMVKVPAKQGVKGSDVQGKEIPAKVGKDIKLVPGKGTEFDPKSDLRLLATVVGLPIESNNGMQIDNVLTIKDVDVTYGHVEFEGSILITGDVQAGMHVKSSGDINIMGFVDSATLDAGGDITVNKSIVGHLMPDGSLSAKATAKGHISAQFVQYAELHAEFDITVVKQLLHSAVHTKRTLIVSDDGQRRGDLIGGEIHAEKGVKAVNIGATAGAKTAIYCAMREGDMKSTLAELTENISSVIELDTLLNNKIQQLPDKQAWANDPEMIAKIKHMLQQKNRVAAQRRDEEKEIEELQAELEKYFASNYIEVRKYLFENVELNIGNAKLKTQREYGPCHIFNRDRQIEFEFNKA